MQEKTSQGYREYKATIESVSGKVLLKGGGAMETLRTRVSTCLRGVCIHFLFQGCSLNRFDDLARVVTCASQSTCF